MAILQLLPPAIPDGRPAAIAEPHASQRRRAVRFVAVAVAAFLVFVAVIVALQLHDGAYRAGFGGHPDEAAHYVTSLMVRDYIALAHPVAPVRFAETFYLHFQKVAVGHWPPLLYIAQAAWMLVVSESRASVLVFMAAVGASLSLCVFVSLRGHVGWVNALFAGVLIISLPVVRGSAGLMMADLPVALLTTCSVLAYGRYLAAPGWRSALSFGLLASAAILTKGNALALGFLPVAAVLFTNRFGLWKELSFWLPVPVVCLLCGPWYYWTFDMARNGWEPRSGLAFTQMVIAGYGQRFITGFGIPVLLAAALGFALALRYRSSSPLPGSQLAAWPAWVTSVLVFSLVWPTTIETRMLTPLAPALAIGVAALAALAGRLERRVTRWAKAVAPAIMGVLIAASLLHPAEPRIAQETGMLEATQVVLRDPGITPGTVLVSARAAREGEFIAELARRRREHNLLTLRASKVLGNALWSGADPVCLFKTPESLLEYLKRVHVSAVVMESDPGYNAPEYHRLLQRTIGKYPALWSLARQQPGDSSIRVYRFLARSDGPREKLVIDMRHMLGREIIE